MTKKEVVIVRCRRCGARLYNKAHKADGIGLACARKEKQEAAARMADSFPVTTYNDTD